MSELIHIKSFRQTAKKVAKVSLVGSLLTIAGSVIYLKKKGAL